ncbi:MAG: hypothetical protein JNL39_12350 [Opitutaceae bacterium]|nr:hypothetical protein [Opitutaceae bacterium]
MITTSVIPRRIIHKLRSRNLPPLEKAALASMMALNPSFEHVHFDETEMEQFVDREFPEYRPVMDAFALRIQRYDFFRYLAVYRLGGFYFDLDVFLNRGLDDLCDSGCVFTFEELTLSRFLRDEHHIDWEIGNYAFGAAAGHPFIRAIIDNCVRAQSDSDWASRMLSDIPLIFRDGFNVLFSTGPGLVTRTLAENAGRARSVKVLFPPDVRDESSWHKFGDYGVHLMASSWRGRDGILKRRAKAIWERTRRRACAAESFKLGPSRSMPGT